MAHRVKPSLLIDTVPSTRRQPGTGTIAVPPAPVSWTYGKIINTPSTDASLPPGWVEVGIPYGNPVCKSVGESDGISTWVGARVMVILDTSGRVVKISDPIAEPGPDDNVEHLGQSGRRLKKALDDSVKAMRAADQVRDNAREAENKASQAARDAAKALKVGEANRPPHVGENAPENPPLGMLWYVTDVNGNITAVRLWDGNQWLPRPLVADSVLVPGSVGDASIKDGAITAPKIYASKELSAKIGAFLEVTTDMLTAGNATIPGTAVVGDLIGNRLMGGELSLIDTDDSTKTMSQDFLKGFEGWSPRTAIVKSMAMRQENGALVFEPSQTEAPLADNVTGPVVPVAEHIGSITGLTESSGDIKLTMDFTVQGEQDGALSIVTASGKNIKRRFTGDKLGNVHIEEQLPDGDPLGAGSNLAVYVEPRPWPPRVIIRKVSLSWRRTRKSGMRIFRDQKGTAKIEITDSVGGVSTLDSSGVSYRPVGGVDSTRRWKTFTTPPLLSVVLKNGTGGGKGDTWIYFTPKQLGDWEILNRGGFTVTDIGYNVPADGFYRLSVNVWFRAIERYTVGAGIMTNGGIDKLGIYTYGETGRNTWRNIYSTGIRRLAAGTRVVPAFYHDYNGFWPITDISFSAEFLHDAD